MDSEKILSSVDHTLLGIASTWEEIKKICDDGMKYGVASVCIPPSYVARAKQYVGDKVLKVIIEACVLTEEEKIAMCKAVTNSGADFIKTSTGFSTGSATREDIKLFAENVGKDVSIKAAGGIRLLQDAEDFITLGASRLGTSSIVKIIKNEEVEGY